MKRILVIQTASIGDVILATPLVESLHLALPDAKIDFLLKKGNEHLFENHPFLNEIIIWDKTNRKYKNYYKILFKLRKKSYDLIINVQRFSSTGLLTVLAGSKQTIGFDKNPFSFFYCTKVKHVILAEGEDLHEVDRNLELLHSLKIKPFRSPRLYPSENDYSGIKKYKTNPYICIAPASLWFTKQFPVEKWVEFANAVPEKLSIFLIGSSSDRELCDRIIAESDNSKVINLAGNLTLLQTASLLKGADMNYVNDSAPQHLASSVNAPVTTIFCSTIPAFGFGPLSENEKVIETHEQLDCRPCGFHGLRSCPKKHFKCAVTITKEQLLDRLADERRDN